MNRVSPIVFVIFRGGRGLHILLQQRMGYQISRMPQTHNLHQVPGGVLEVWCADLHCDIRKAAVE
jgi:hypothetical protein